MVRPCTLAHMIQGSMYICLIPISFIFTFFFNLPSSLSHAPMFPSILFLLILSPEPYLLVSRFLIPTPSSSTPTLFFHFFFYCFLFILKKTINLDSKQMEFIPSISLLIVDSDGWCCLQLRSVWSCCVRLQSCDWFGTSTVMMSLFVDFGSVTVRIGWVRDWTVSGVGCVKIEWAWHRFGFDDDGFV